MSLNEFKKKIIELKKFIDEDRDLEEKKYNAIFEDVNKIMRD